MLNKFYIFIIYVVRKNEQRSFYFLYLYFYNLLVVLSYYLLNLYIFLNLENLPQRTFKHNTLIFKVNFYNTYYIFIINV